MTNMVILEVKMYFRVHEKLMSSLKAIFYVSYANCKVAYFRTHFEGCPVSGHCDAIKFVNLC